MLNPLKASNHCFFINFNDTRTERNNCPLWSCSISKIIFKVAELHRFTLETQFWDSSTFVQVEAALKDNLISSASFFSLVKYFRPRSGRFSPQGSERRKESQLCSSPFIGVSFCPTICSDLFLSIPLSRLSVFLSLSNFLGTVIH